MLIAPYSCLSSRHLLRGTHVLQNAFGTFLGRKALKKYFSTDTQKTPNLVIEKATSFDPFFNLAYEEWLFNRALTSDTHILYLWRNDPTIVIGKHQNPWKEINIPKMNEQGVNLVRRTSGGGAVYQDHGNTNFTFLSPRDKYDPRLNTQILIEALASFNITAEASGRNDMVANGAKFSGSAYRLKPDRAFHHGTLLISADLGALSSLLNPNKAKLLSKGVESVRARVTNLSEHNASVSHDSLCERIVQEFARAHGVSTPPTPRYVNADSVEDPTLLTRFAELKSDEWTYGKSPDFTNNFETRFSWGVMDVHVDVRGNVVGDAKVFSDCLLPQLVEAFEESLTGKSYSRQGFSDAAEETAAQFASDDNGATVRSYTEELKEWLLSQL